MFTYVLTEYLRETILNFFVEDVIRGNSVQIALDFPVKSLSIYLNEFFSTPFWLFNEKITYLIKELKDKTLLLLLTVWNNWRKKIKIKHETVNIVDFYLITTIQNYYSNNR